MRAGKLNRRVSLQKRGAARDTAGQPLVDGWTEIARLWANIRYLNGREYATSDTKVSGATASIRVRYRADLDATLRIVYRDAVFNILAVLPDEQDRDHVDLACNTGVNDG
ncbi:phage head closure protein [Paraburkholderia sp. Cy-641]|nr:phage head closure protein [Paraburkholderia sp. Cy-641]